MDTGPYPEVTQVASEREKHRVHVVRTIRALLVSCKGGRSSSQCPACGVSCQVVSTYHSITPTHTVIFFVLCNRSAGLHRDEMFAEEARIFLTDVLLCCVLCDIYLNFFKRVDEGQR